MEKTVQLIGISGKIGSGKDIVGKVIQGFTIGQSSETILKNLQSKWFVGYTCNWEIKKFATKVKEICSLLTGIPVENFEKEEVKSSYLGEEWNWGGQGHGPKYTVRQLLQYVGTNAMRDVIHPDVWVNALMKDYIPLKEQFKNSLTEPSGYEVNDIKVSYDREKYPNWLITDVRFPNEAKAIKDKGGIIIRVDRPRHIPTDTKGVYIDLDKSRTENEITDYSKHESETALDDYKFDYVIENDSDIPTLISRVKVLLMSLNLV